MLISQLQKHLLQRLVVYFLIISAILVVVTLSSRFVDVLSGFISRGLPLDNAFWVFWGLVPEGILVVFGLSLFLSVILLLTNMSAYSETPVIYSFGLSKLLIIRTVSLFMIMVVPVMLWVSLYYSPVTKWEGKRLFIQTQNNPNIKPVPKSFQHFGNHTFFAQTEDRGVLGLFFLRYKKEDVYTLITADKANIDFQEGVVLLKLHDGYQIQEGSALDEPVSILRFGRMETAISLGGTKVQKTNRVDYKSVGELLENRAENKHRVELHWRFAVVLTAVLMAYIAVFLVPYRPRSNRFAFVGVGLLVFVIFATLLTSMKHAATDGKIAVDLAFGSVYFGQIVILVLLMFKHLRG